MKMASRPRPVSSLPTLVGIQIKHWHQQEVLYCPQFAQLVVKETSCSGLNVYPEGLRLKNVHSGSLSQPSSASQQKPDILIHAAFWFTFKEANFQYTVVEVGSVITQNISPCTLAGNGSKNTGSRVTRLHPLLFRVCSQNASPALAVGEDLIFIILKTHPAL